MGGGAWPFLVGGVTCLVYSDNERDLSLLNSDVEEGPLKRMTRDGDWCMEVLVTCTCRPMVSCQCWSSRQQCKESLLRGTIGVEPKEA